MEGNGFRFTIDLGIDAKRIMQQIQMDNRVIEEQIQKGIELALADITKEDSLVQLVRENVLNSITGIVNKCVMSYELQNKIRSMVEEKMSQRLDAVATKIVDNITTNLEF